MNYYESRKFLRIQTKASILQKPANIFEILNKKILQPKEEIAIEKFFK